MTPRDLAESTNLGVTSSAVSWVIQLETEDEQLLGEMSRNSVLSALSFRWLRVSQV